jgi:hypothetical protein
LLRVQQFPPLAGVAASGVVVKAETTLAWPITEKGVD